VLISLEAGAAAQDHLPELILVRLFDVVLVGIVEAQ